MQISIGSFGHQKLWVVFVAVKENTSPLTDLLLQTSQTGHPLSPFRIKQLEVCAAAECDTMTLGIS